MPPRPRPTPSNHLPDDGFVHVRGAREHNLKDVSLRIPRDALVVFTGVSGSGKSSLAFGTLYAEAQRRYLESVSPYARRLFHQMSNPDVDEIDGLPPAVALQQQRGAPTTRSSVGSVTTLSNLLRMLYSRAGDYPRGQPIIYAEGFSPNTPEGACATCHGLGRVYDVTEKSMVPDPTKTIRDRAIAAWPLAWGGQNQRDILVSMGIDVDVPWKDLPKKTRDWILFTEERPEVPVYPGYTPAETRRAIKRNETPNYMGRFIGAKNYVLTTFATTQSALMKKRVARFMTGADCPTCHGKRLKPEALRVKFAGMDIAEISHLPLKQLHKIAKPFLDGIAPGWAKLKTEHPEKAEVTTRILEDLQARCETLLNLGLGYLSLERSTPTLSPGELQRLRLATQVRANLFGVVYVLDEPCAGLHPADTEALLAALDQLKAAGNTLFVVEHDLDVMRHADWIVDVGPDAGTQGGEILYSGAPYGLKQIKSSHTATYLFNGHIPLSTQDSALKTPRSPQAWLKLEHVTRNNLHDLAAEFPLGVLTTVTGVSGSGKSSLVSQTLVDLVCAALGHDSSPDNADTATGDSVDLESAPVAPTVGRISEGLDRIKRLVRVDQKPIGRTPRSNLATYTGLFDHVRKLFAATRQARARHYSAGRFSFNVAAGRCPHCAGEGFVMVELLFLPSVYTPCPTCHGQRYNPKTLEITYEGKYIAEVLDLTVDAAHDFFAAVEPVHRALAVLREVGLGYIRLGQPATELSGGEAQRIKLATELQRAGRGDTLYVLDEPTTGLHPHDVEKLIVQLDRLTDAGNTV
ncbi:MAG: excinuclease ABC subunit A, partial [Phycisphaerae bacterium]